MEPASHILEWAHNSVELYRRLVRLSKSTSASVYKASEAAHLAASTVREMVVCGEIRRDEYSAMDVIDAAKLMLGWSGEE